MTKKGYGPVLGAAVKLIELLRRIRERPMTQGATEATDAFITIESNA